MSLAMVIANDALSLIYDDKLRHNINENE